MFGFNSLAPAKLYTAGRSSSPDNTTTTTTSPSPRPKEEMGDVQPAMASAGAVHADDDGLATRSDAKLATTTTLASEQRPHHSQTDSGVGVPEAIRPQAPVDIKEPEPASQHATAAMLHEKQPQPLSLVEPKPEPSGFHTPPETVAKNSSGKNSVESIDFINRLAVQAGPSSSTTPNAPPAAEAGPSTAAAAAAAPPKRASSHSSVQRDSPLATAAAAAPAPAAAERPDESEFNAIAYRRDPETVIAYLVPLPQPTIQGATLPTAPKYFLYAPPPPHLLKPPHGEGYVRKLNRHWQQNTRRATRNAHNGRRLSARGIHSKLIRGCTHALDKLKADDVTFLARIHPKTVNHLILIHPWGLAGTQTPEEVMRTFRAQMFESKKRAKRDSILSAVFFLPALVIDTAAIFFGGLAEIDGIWMLVSVTAYRTAKFITKKMGPEPKTLELEQAKLIEDAKKSGFPPPAPEPEEKEPGAARKSIDALRRSLGSARHRMSLTQQRRSMSRKRKGGEGRPSTETPTEAARADPEAFSGGDLAHHAEESEEHATGEVRAAPPSTAATAVAGSELMDEDDDQRGQQPSGGIFSGTGDDNRVSVESGRSRKGKKNGQNFQLTFYPSPAMEVLARYVQQSCHMKRAQVFPSPMPVPTEEDVLAVVGWHPERRPNQTAEEQAADEEWQTREIKEDLRQTARKAAKAWNKSCRKEVKQMRRTSRKGFVLFRRHAKVEKGKSKQAPIAAAAVDDDDDHVLPATNEKKKKKRGGGKLAAGAALLCAPIAGRVKGRKARKDAMAGEPQSEKGASGGLKQRLADRRNRKKSVQGPVEDPFLADHRPSLTGNGPPPEPVGLETPTAILDGPIGDDTDRHIMSASAAAAVADGAEADPTTDPVAEDGVLSDKKSKSKKGGLFAMAAAIGAALKKRRGGKATTTEDGVTATNEEKRSKFSALKARRTRVAKKEPKPKKRSSGLMDWIKELKQKRRNKKVNKAKSTSESQATTAVGSRPPTAKTTAQEHGAVAGLFAACFALPAVKVKQAREKRRSTKAAKSSASASEFSAATAAPTGEEEASGVPGTPLSPVLEEQRSARATSEPAVASSPTIIDHPATSSYQAPSVTEEYDDPPEELPVASQYLPGHGQSEVPVEASGSNIALERTSAAVETPPAQPTRAQAASAAAGVKFKSMRDGLGSLATRRRSGTSEQVADASAERSGEPIHGESTPTASTGRLQSFRKRRAPSSTDGEDRASGPPNPIKAVIGNMKAKKNGTDQPQMSEKAPKDKGPSFMERMRWLFLMA